MTCPICSNPTHRVFEKDGYTIVGCSVCGHRCLATPPPADHVTALYGDDYFFGGGAGYHDYLSEGAILRRHGARYAVRIAPYVRPARLLDVGAAAGFVLKGFCDAGWDGHGIEPNPGMAAYARRELQLDVQVGTLESLAAGTTYDLISMIQVAAHFHDLSRAMTHAATATAPGGHWLIETWNCASWTARVFGIHWHEYSPPSVQHWFTRESLRRLAACHGFDQVATGRPAKWLNAGHAKSLLRHALGAVGRSRVFDLGARLLPDHARIPYPAEDLFWALFRRAR